MFLLDKLFEFRDICKMIGADYHPNTQTSNSSIYPSIGRFCCIQHIYSIQLFYLTFFFTAALIFYKLFIDVSDTNTFAYILITFILYQLFFKITIIHGFRAMHLLEKKGNNHIDILKYYFELQTNCLKNKALE